MAADIVGDIDLSPDIVGDAWAAPCAARCTYSPQRHRLLVLLVASTAGCWAKEFALWPLDGRYDDWMAEVGYDLKVVAFAEVSAMLYGADHVFEAGAGRIPQFAQRLLRGDVQGYLVYEIVRIVAFAHAVAVANNDVGHDLWATARDWLTAEGRTLHDLAVEWCGPHFRRPDAFVVCPTLAAGVCFLGWQLLHVVAFTGKFNRRRTIGSYPSASTLSRFRESLAAEQQGAPQPESVRAGTNPWGGMSAEQILRWVEFTSYTKNLRECEHAALAAEKLFRKGKPDSLLHVMHKGDIIDKETLRRARVRTDLVAMQVFRLMYPQLDRPTFHVWTDASPQWRGLEYCASSFDTYHNGTLTRRLMPCVSLTRGRTSAVHKCLALLWQCFLMVGPAQLQQFCRSIRGIVTDMGVERLIVRMPVSVLSNFFRHLGSNVVVELDSPWLFPHALGIPGWKHALDLITRRCLWLLPFMPKFIKCVKAIIGFLREDRAIVCEDLRKRGYVGLAGMVRKAAFPNFAAWRWSTLDGCLKSILPFVDSLSVVFDPTSFRNSRDATKIKLVCEAFQSRAWKSQLKVVAFFCDTTTRLLNWGGGCRCHNAEDPRRTECKFKGRLLPEAYPHAMQHLRADLDEVTSWTVGFVDGDAVLLRQAQACMRGAWMFAQEKLQHLDELPHFLSRLNEAGIRDRVVAQWAEAAADAHDPVSAEFLDESSPLRADVLAMAADGTGMSKRLRSAWDSLRQVPIDDTPGEGPHASMRHQQLRTRGATWAWQASSARLTQNLKDIDTVLPTLKPRTDLQWLWDRWSSVLQVSLGRKLNKNKRVRRKGLEDNIYTMWRFRDFRLEDAPADIDKHADDGDVPVGEDGDPGDGGGEEEEAAADDDGFGRLLREYYQAAVSSRVGSFFSVQGEGGERHRAFQLLAFKPTVSLVRSFRKRKAFVCKMSVMWLPTWAARNLDTAPLLDVFEVSDPEHIDLHDFVRGIDDRGKFCSWSEVPSDVDGCIALVRPVVVEVDSHLNGKKVPVLCLVDALKAAGYAFVDRLVVHKPADALKLVDGRRLASKRHYFQCVLASAVLWGRGLPEFRSHGPSGYYWLLLHNKAAGLTKENMKRRLADLDGDAIELQILQRPAKLQRHDEEGDDELVGDDGGAPGPAAPAVEEPSSTESCSSSSSVAGDCPSSPSDGIAGDDLADGYDLPTHIDGVKVQVEEHPERGDRGLRIKCPVHENCRKCFVAQGQSRLRAQKC